MATTINNHKTSSLNEKGDEKVFTAVQRSENSFSVGCSADERITVLLKFHGDVATSKR